MIILFLHFPFSHIYQCLYLRCTKLHFHTNTNLSLLLRPTTGSITKITKSCTHHCQFIYIPRLLVQCCNIIHWRPSPWWCPPFAWCSWMITWHSWMITWHSWGTLLPLIRLQRHSSWKVVRVGHDGLPWRRRRVQWRTWRVRCFDGVSKNRRLGLRTNRLGTEIEWRPPITPSTWSYSFVDVNTTTHGEKGRKVIKIRLWVICLECLVATTLNLDTYNIRRQRLHPP